MDFEKFCVENENNPNNTMLESIKWVIKIFENKLGIKIKVSEEELKNLIKYFNENGTINDDGKEQLESNCSKEEIEQYILFESQMNTKLTSNKFENVMKDLFYFNDNIRNNINAYCLTETNINNTQWARYADEEKGFCIEYTLPTKIDNDFIKNLYPIIYAKKK